jgi:hypothetical protein
MVGDQLNVIHIFLQAGMAAGPTKLMDRRMESSLPHTGNTILAACFTAVGS